MLKYLVIAYSACIVFLCFEAALTTYHAIRHSSYYGNKLYLELMEQTTACCIEYVWVLCCVVLCLCYWNVSCKHTDAYHK